MEHKKLETTFSGIVSVMIFAISIAMGIVEGDWYWWVLTPLSALFFLGCTKPTEKPKHIGNLFIFKGETEKHVAIGLEITEDVEKVLGLGEGVLTIVDQRNK